MVMSEKGQKKHHLSGHKETEKKYEVNTTNEARKRNGNTATSN
jgi:hypothetical protein